MSYKRKSDKTIDTVNGKMDKVLEILNGNGDIGVCAQVHINKKDINEIKKKPGNVKNYIVAVAIIINTLVAAIAVYKGVT